MLPTTSSAASASRPASTCGGARRRAEDRVEALAPGGVVLDQVDVRLACRAAATSCGASAPAHRLAASRSAPPAADCRAAPSAHRRSPTGCGIPPGPAPASSRVTGATSARARRRLRQRLDRGSVEIRLEEHADRAGLAHVAAQLLRVVEQQIQQQRQGQRQRHHQQASAASPTAARRAGRGSRKTVQVLFAPGAQAQARRGVRAPRAAASAARARFRAVLRACGDSCAGYARAKVVDQAAVIEHEHALAHALDQRPDRGWRSSTVVPTCWNSPNRRHDLGRQLRIEIAGRLVGDQHRRLGDDRARDADALLLAGRQRDRRDRLRARAGRPCRALRARACRFPRARRRR